MDWSAMPSKFAVPVPCYQTICELVVVSSWMAGFLVQVLFVFAILPTPQGIRERYPVYRHSPPLTARTETRVCTYCIH